MKILISGFGSHAKRRIVPALLNCNEVKEIDVILRNDNKDGSPNIKFVDLSEVENKKYDNVIISSPPYAHKENLMSLKENSDNFIIEKPIFDNLNDLTDDNLISEFKNKNIFEGLMYFYHPIWSEVKNIFDTESVIEFSSSFTIPHIEDTNYRYIKDKGGGFTLDLGVYPISLFFNLIGHNFEIIKQNLYCETDFQVDLGGNIQIKTEKDIIYTGKWGVGFEYTNHLNIKTNKKTYNFPFIFTKDENFYSYYIEKEKNIKRKIEIGKYDQFQLMYEYFFSKKINQYGLNNDLFKTYKLLFDLISNK